VLKPLLDLRFLTPSVRVFLRSTFQTRVSLFTRLPLAFTIALDPQSRLILSSISSDSVTEVLARLLHDRNLHLRI
jgi:hypothetical protein